MTCSLSSKNSPRNTVDFEAACSVYIRFRGVNGYVPMSKYKRSGRPQSSRCKRTTRPRLEALESRLVLSSTVLPTMPSPAPFAGRGNAVVEGLYRNILG